MQSEVFHNSFADTAPTTERVLVLETCFISTSIADIVLLLRYIYSLTPHEFLQNVRDVCTNIVFSQHSVSSAEHPRERSPRQDGRPIPNATPCQGLHCST